EEPPGRRVDQTTRSRAVGRPAFLVRLEAHQSEAGSDPDVAAMVLEQRIHGVGRQLPGRDVETLPARTVESHQTAGRGAEPRPPVSVLEQREHLDVGKGVGKRVPALAVETAGAE